VRAFIAIKIEASDEIRQLLEKLDSLEGVKAVESENVHVLLKFFGEIEENDVDKIKKVMDDFSGAGVLQLELKEIGAFPKPEFARVVWIGAHSNKLVELQAILEEKLEAIGFNRDTRNYKPHVTLARIKKIPSKEVQDILSDRSFGITSANEISLFKSKLTSQGPIYTVLHTIKL